MSFVTYFLTLCPVMMSIFCQHGIQLTSNYWKERGLGGFLTREAAKL